MAKSSQLDALASQLKNFSPKETAIRIAALLTFPDLHPYTLRIENLLSLVLRHCQGEHTPTKNRIKIWIQNFLASQAVMEDPAEYLFISNVITERGDYKLFEGFTVADFLYLPEDQVRELLTVTGLRTYKELQGLPCHQFSLSAPTKKSLACTRSFGRSITEWEEMRQAIVTYVTRAAEKMRRHNLAGAAMQVFMHTNRFNNDPSYANQTTFQLEPTDDTLALISNAVRAAHSIFRPGYRYAKAGVIFIDLFLKNELQPQMFSTIDPVKSAKLMGALDAVNLKYGRNTLTAGGVLPENGGWTMKRQNLSPCFTTQFEDILSVKAV